MKTIIIFFLLIARTIIAADTGWLNPTSTGKIYNNWYLPERGFTSNSLWTNTGSTLGQDYGNYNVNLPGNAVIGGIEVSVEASCEANGNTEVIGIEISNNGGVTWSNTGYQLTYTLEADVVKTVGSSTSLWGLTWGIPNTTNSNLLVRITRISGTIRIYMDAKSIKLHYTTSSYLGDLTYLNNRLVTKKLNGKDVGFMRSNGYIDPYLKSESEALQSDCNVFFAKNFDSRPLGYYSQQDWLTDFNNTSQNNDWVRANTQIVNNATNLTRGLRIYFPENSTSCCGEPVVCNGVSYPQGGVVAYVKLNNNASTDEAYFQSEYMFSQGYDFGDPSDNVGGGKMFSFQAGEWHAVSGIPGKDTVGYNVTTFGLMFSKEGLLQMYMYWPDYDQAGEHGKTILWGSPYELFEGFFTDGDNAACKAYCRYSRQTVVNLHNDGQSHTIGMRVRLNTVGQYDGLVECYHDGELVMTLDSMKLRLTNTLKIDNFRLTAFNGGGRGTCGTPSFTFWDNKVEGYYYVDNIFIWNYKNNVNVPRGYQFSPRGRILKKFIPQE